MSDEKALFDTHQELAAMAALMRDYGRFTALGITEAAFAVPKHLAVFQAAQRVADNGSSVTFESVALELQRSGMDAVVGGQAGLLELRRGVPGTLLDAQRLKNLAALRMVRECLFEAYQLAGQEDLAGSLAKLDEATQFGKSDAKILTLLDLAERAREESSEHAKSERKLFYPGSYGLVQSIKGFRAGGMYVLGALSNVGKSYIAQSWAIRCATEGTKVGWISLEDPEITTGSRALGMLSGIEPRRIELGELYSQERDAAAVETGMGFARELRNHFLYTDLTGRTEIDVCGGMSMMAGRGAKVIFVDYVGVIGCSKPSKERHNEIRIISMRLKAHAKRLGVALVLISQLTMPRDETGVAKEPSKYALRECGDLTNAAEAIIIAWRENENDEATVNVKVAKSKVGGVGKHWLVKRDLMTHIMEDVSAVAVRVNQKPPARRGFGLGS